MEAGSYLGKRKKTKESHMWMSRKDRSERVTLCAETADGLCKMISGTGPEEVFLTRTVSVGYMGK